METLFGNIEQLIQNNPWLALIVTYLGGLVTASNPCVLAMVPLMIGFVGGSKEIIGLKKALLFSLLFVSGLSLTFAALGLIVALAGRLMGDIGGYWKYIIAGVCFLMGLHLLDVFTLNIPSIGGLKPTQKGLLGAFILGLLFGVVSTPCAAPILIVLLTYVAAKESSLVYGTTLLLTYAFGHCTLIFITGTSIGMAKKVIQSKRLNKANRILKIASGILIILVGFYFLLS